MQEKRPEYLIAVPRLYESLHKTITTHLKAQTGAARRVIDASMAVTSGYTAARDVFKGLVVGDKQPSIVVKVSADALFLVRIYCLPENKVSDGSFVPSSLYIVSQMLNFCALRASSWLC